MSPYLNRHGWKLPSAVVNKLLNKLLKHKLNRFLKRKII